MARAAATSVENNFIKGKITQATGLNFPENAVVDDANCVFDNIGAVERRLGFDYEDSFVLNSVTRTGGHISEFIWRNVGGSPSLSFVVVQVENILHFYILPENGAVSANKKSFTFNLDTKKTAGSPDVRLESCQYSFGRGLLFVSHPYTESFFIEYNSGSDTISATTINIRIRDTEGLDDGLAVDNRPLTLSTEHKYNLFNQGWYPIVQTSGATQVQAIDHWHTRTQADYPSNSDLWWTYKDSNEDFNLVFINKFDVPTSQAPRGHYVLDAFNQDRSTASGVAGIPVVTSSFYRPSTNAFFAQRMWYSSVNFGNFVNKLYFSPVIERNTQFGDCFQVGDPPSENGAGLVASDGGFISINEAGRILKLVVVQDSLFVFATNGIWSITGSQGIGFTADDFLVRSVVRLVTPSILPFVDADGIPIWWSQGGIYTVAGVDSSGGAQIENITDETIKDFFNNIPYESKLFAKGAYDPASKIVQWLYKQAAPVTEFDKFNYDAVLNFNVLTKSFYSWFPDTSAGVTVNGLFSAEGTGPDTNIFESFSSTEDNGWALSAVLGRTANNTVSVSVAGGPEFLVGTPTVVVSAGNTSIVPLSSAFTGSTDKASILATITPISPSGPAEATFHLETGQPFLTETLLPACRYQSGYSISIKGSVVLRAPQGKEISEDTVTWSREIAFSFDGSLNKFQSFNTSGTDSSFILPDTFKFFFSRNSGVETPIPPSFQLSISKTIPHILRYPTFRYKVISTTAFASALADSSPFTPVLFENGSTGFPGNDPTGYDITHADQLPPWDTSNPAFFSYSAIANSSHGLSTATMSADLNQNLDSVSAESEWFSNQQDAFNGFTINSSNIIALDGSGFIDAEGTAQDNTATVSSSFVRLVKGTFAATGTNFTGNDPIDLDSLSSPLDTVVYVIRASGLDFQTEATWGNTDGSGSGSAVFGTGQIWSNSTGSVSGKYNNSDVSPDGLLLDVRALNPQDASTGVIIHPRLFVQTATQHGGTEVKYAVAADKAPSAFSQPVQVTTLPSVFRYVTSKLSTGTTYNATFAQVRDGRYLDWFSNDSIGVSFNSYFISGFRIRGDAQRKFQSNYIHTFLDNLFDSSCFVQITWDWNVPISGTRTYSRQQVYNPVGTRQVNFSRRKLRGSGLSAQLRFESEPEKPFRLIGWSILDSANSGI